MTKYFSILTLILLLLVSCSKNEDLGGNNDKQIEPEFNLPPNNFDVEILNISHQSATINWSEAIDPENDTVTYSIYLNQTLIIENISVLNHQLTGLDELTDYSGKIIAKDSKNNETSKTFSFTTTKYYLKFLKEYYYEDSTNLSVGIPTDMIKTMDGGYVVVGISTDDNGFSNQLFSLKIDSEGNEIWKHFYGYDINSLLLYFNVTQLNDGGFVIATSQFIIKIDSNGNEIWYTTNSNFINPDYDFLITYGEMVSVKEDSQGNIFVVGYRDVSNPIDDPISQYGVLTKLNSLGQIIWEKEFKNAYRSQFNDLLIDDNDNIIILGTAETSGVTEVNGLPNGAEQIDPWVIKTNNDGEIIWDKYYLNIGYDFTQKILKVKDGNYVFIGFSWGAYDIGSGTILKITPNGDEVWKNNISLSSVFSVDETKDGGFVTVGHIDSSTFDLLGISKLNANGDEEWSRSYWQNDSHLRGKSIFQTDDEGYIFLSSYGKNYYYGDDRAKILIYKTDPEGNYE